MSKKFRKLIIKIPQFLEEHGIDYDETSSGEIKIIECPSCSKIKKLYVDPETGVAQCKSASCDLNRGVSPFDLVIKLLGVSKGEAYKLCFGESEEGKKDIFQEDEDESFENYVNKKKEDLEPENIELPVMSEDLDKEKHKEAWDYLINRGYNDEIIRKLGAKILPFPTWQEGWKELIKKRLSPDEIKKNLIYINRVIFPLYINGNIKGYIARDFTGKVESQYKALNSYGSFRSNYFWNYDNAKNSEELILCEGITDALKCGVSRSVALLGAVATKKQIELMKTMNAKKIVFCLDVGTDKSKKTIYEDLMLSYPGNIYEVVFPEILISKQKINDKIIEAISELNPDGKFKLKLINDHTIELSYELYDDIKKKLKSNWFKLDSENTEKMILFFKEANYKDAGDYSLEEMDKMIANAMLYRKNEVNNDGLETL